MYRKKNLPLLEDVRSVIFDLDGTLVDSMWLWHDIDLEFLGERGIALPETYQKDIEGMSFTETAVYTKDLFQLPESVEELKEIWNRMAIEKYTYEVPFKPGAEEFLKYCRTKGITVGIATSNSRGLVEAVAGALHFEDYIQEIVTACEVEHGKPAPDVYLEAASRLQAQPERCLVFEDVPMGILAGMQIPGKNKRQTGWIAAAVFVATYIPLMAKFFSVILEKEA